MYARKTEEDLKKSGDSSTSEYKLKSGEIRVFFKCLGWLRVKNPGHPTQGIQQFVKSISKNPYFYETLEPLKAPHNNRYSPKENPPEWAIEVITTIPQSIPINKDDWSTQHMLLLGQTIKLENIHKVYLIQSNQLCIDVDNEEEIREYREEGILNPAFMNPEFIFDAQPVKKASTDLSSILINNMDDLDQPTLVELLKATLKVHLSRGNGINQILKECAPKTNIEKKELNKPTLNPTQSNINSLENKTLENKNSSFYTGLTQFSSTKPMDSSSTSSSISSSSSTSSIPSNASTSSISSSSSKHRAST